jgi:heptaprenylglyceryl phosphate synthase
MRHALLALSFVTGVWAQTAPATKAVPKAVTKAATKAAPAKAAPAKAKAATTAKAKAKAGPVMDLLKPETVKGTPPDFTTIARLAAECRMPICYGGGIRTVEQARRIIEEKEARQVERIKVPSAPR